MSVSFVAIAFQRNERSGQHPLTFSSRSFFSSVCVCMCVCSHLRFVVSTLRRYFFFFFLIGGQVTRLFIRERLVAFDAISLVISGI